MSGLFLNLSKASEIKTSFIHESFKLASSRGKNSSSVLQAASLSKLELVKSRSRLEKLSDKIKGASKLVIGYCGLNVTSEQEIRCLSSKLSDFLCS